MRKAETDAGVRVVVAVAIVHRFGIVFVLPRVDMGCMSRPTQFAMLSRPSRAFSDCLPRRTEEISTAQTPLVPLHVDFTSDWKHSMGSAWTALESRESLDEGLASLAAADDM